MLSFCSPIPVNCATTTLLNPSALSPSAWRPHIPNTERREILKIYGDAEFTVSTTTESTGTNPARFGVATAGAVSALYLRVNGSTISEITKFPLYPGVGIPLILIAVLTLSPTAGVFNVTVIVSVEVVPSPAWIESIINSAPFEPTIWNSPPIASISIPDWG